MSVIYKNYNRQQFYKLYGNFLATFKSIEQAVNNLNCDVSVLDQVQLIIFKQFSPTAKKLKRTISPKITSR